MTVVNMCVKILILGIYLFYYIFEKEQMCLGQEEIWHWEKNEAMFLTVVSAALGFCFSFWSENGGKNCLIQNKSTNRVHRMQSSVIHVKYTRL